MWRGNVKGYVLFLYKIYKEMPIGFVILLKISKQTEGQSQMFHTEEHFSFSTKHVGQGQISKS